MSSSVFEFKFIFPLFGVLQPEAASVFSVQEKAAGKAIPDVFSGKLLLQRKEEFAGNALQNGGNRRGNLYSHRTKPVAVTAWRRQHGILGPI